MQHNQLLLNTAELKEQLINRGVTLPSDFDASVRSLQQETELPLYLRALTGAGAFFASWCFFGFLSTIGFLKFWGETGMMLWGAVLMICAIVLHRKSEHYSPLWHSAAVQCSFATVALGKILFVIGVSEMIGSDDWGMVIGIFTVTCATYYVYRMSIDRFISCTATLLTLSIELFRAAHDSPFEMLTLHAIMLVLLAASAILLTQPWVRQRTIPLAYACVAVLIMVVMTLTIAPPFITVAQQFTHPALINGAFTVTMLLLIGWVAGSMHALFKPPLLFACVGTIVLGCISAPGLLLAVGLMVLGYARHDNILTVAGIVQLPIFIIAYYYNLDVSLLQKSASLLGGGLLLLLGRLYLHYNTQQQENTSCGQ